jgi:hypothetical protein
MRDDRGQTAQDFAVGISVFVLTTAFALAYVPTAVFPFDQAPDGETATQADRLADSLVADFAVDGSRTTLNESATRTFLRHNNSSAAIRANYSLPATASVNVTLEHPNGTAVNATAWDAAAGTRYADQEAGVASRLVTVGGSRYRLVVRVW